MATPTTRARLVRLTTNWLCQRYSGIGYRTWTRLRPRLRELVDPQTGERAVTKISARCELIDPEVLDRLVMSGALDVGTDEGAA